METETPINDKHCLYCAGMDDREHLIELDKLSRQLERELAEARKDSSRIDKMERECEHSHGRRHIDGQYGTRKSWEVSTDFDQGPLSLREAIDEWGGDE